MSLVGLPRAQRSKGVCRGAGRTVHAQFPVAETAGRCHGAWIRGACFRLTKVENLFRLGLFRRLKSVECRAMIGEGDLFVALFTSLCFCKSPSRSNSRWGDVDFFGYKHDYG